MNQDSPAYRNLVARKEKIEASLREKAEYRESNSDELSHYDNHPAEMGTELSEKEKEFIIEEQYKKELEEINIALNNIANGSYGYCLECGVEIPEERLEILPETQYCVKHSPKQELHSDRPVEEAVLKEGFSSNFNYEDSFEEVARYGTSETPADFSGHSNRYNDLYQDENLDE